jgi:predicted aminopeptidase
MKLTGKKIALFVCAVFVLFIAGFVVFGFYLVKQGAYIIAYGLEAQSIEGLLAKGTPGANERDFLRRVTDIKRYAVTRLGLTNNANYTTYLRLDRDYLVDVVSACKKDRFEEYVWQYPFFGGFPYKGFFERKDADAEAKDLKKMNLDVIIRKVDAFSTLGFFKDPVYDFMAEYSAYELASTIIHEQTHATVWIKDEVQLNEELAVFVGREGGLLYIADTYGVTSKEYKDALRSTDDSASFTDFIKSAYKALDVLYTSDIPESEKLVVRGIVMHAYKERYRLDAVRKALEENAADISGTADKYAAFPLNNAFIMLFMGYEENLTPFYELYRSFNNDLPKTIEYLTGLKTTKKKTMEYILDGTIKR